MIERTTVPMDHTAYLIAFAFLLVVMLIALYYVADDPNF